MPETLMWPAVLLHDRGSWQLATCITVQKKSSMPM